MKQKMSEEKKAKLIYSGELIFIAIIFLVLGILKLIGIFNTSETAHKIFSFITMAGGLWVVTDFFWSNFSSKRRPTVTILDKYLALPVGIFLIIFDIFCYCNNWYSGDTTLWKYAIGALFLYIAVIYSFQGIFHYFHPTKELLRAIEEDRKTEELKQTQENVQEPQETSKEEDK